MKHLFVGPLKQVSISMILAFSATGVWSQTAANYPDKPVKVIIPFPPGGTLDKIGRMLALKVGDKLFGPISMPFGLGLGALGAWISISGTQAIQGILSMIVFRQGAWKTKKV